MEFHYCKDYLVRIYQGMFSKFSQQYVQYVSSILLLRYVISDSIMIFLCTYSNRISYLEKFFDMHLPILQCTHLFDISEYVYLLLLYFNMLSMHVVKMGGSYSSRIQVCTKVGQRKIFSLKFPLFLIANKKILKKIQDKIQNISHFENFSL